MRYTTVQAVASRLMDQFNVEMTLDQVVIHSAQVLKNMGMIALQREIIKATVSNFSINLPARVRKVRGVIRLDPAISTGMSVEIQDIWFPPQTVWVSADEDLVLTNDELVTNKVPHLRGPYIPYVWDHPYLKFNETDLDVAIISTSIKSDDRGYPMIPDEAFEAAVYYCLYVYYQPLFLLNKVQMGVWQQITEWKNQKMRFAGTSLMMEELSQNEMNDVFDVLTSFDRKKFGVDA